MNESADYNTGMDDERDRKDLTDSNNYLGFVRNRTSYYKQHTDVQSVFQMSCEDINHWISGLPSLGAQARHVSDLLRREYVDGATFHSMEFEDFVSIGVDPHFSKILASVKTAGATPSSKYFSRAESNGGDVPRCQTDHSAQMQYGQLLTLGYKSYKVSRGAVCTPVGVVNDVFCLISRAANPLCCATTHKGVDIFQLGRCDDGCNDWLLRGVMQDDVASSLGPGSVSRYMCRIVCDRHPPHTARLYASGYNSESKRMSQTLSHEGVVVPACAPQWDLPDGTKDAFTSRGVRLWSPSRKMWAEVSVQGLMFDPVRSQEVSAGRKVPVPLSGMTNELESGSILDLGGVLLLFASQFESSSDHSDCTNKLAAIASSWQHTDNISSRIVQSMNRLRPQCPVLMDSICFTSSPPAKRRAQFLWEQQKGCFDRPIRAKHLLTHDSVDGATNSERNRVPYVFSACGHVHGYSKQLEGRPCPLCRMVGPYVPLQPACESMICSKWPTHVFNPCGHAASLDVCMQWVATPLPDICAPRKFDLGALCPCCPFCLVKLEMDAARGGPFNRLIIQYEDADLEDEAATDIESAASISVCGRSTSEEYNCSFTKDTTSDSVEDDMMQCSS